MCARGIKRQKFAKEQEALDHDEAIAAKEADVEAADALTEFGHLGERGVRERRGCRGD